jgi:hypothetical protein
MENQNKELPIKRSNVIKSLTFKNKVSCCTLYITIGYDDINGMLEAFIAHSKAGGCSALLEATGRLTSLALRYKVPLTDILKQLHGIRCPACTNFIIKEQEEVKRKNNGELPETYKQTIHFSCPDTLGKVLSKVDKQLKGESKNGKDL